MTYLEILGDMKSLPAYGRAGRSNLVKLSDVIKVIEKHFPVSADEFRKKRRCGKSEFERCG